MSSSVQSDAARDTPITTLLAVAFSLLYKRLASLILLGIASRLLWSLALGPVTSLIVGFLVERKGRYSFGNNDLIGFALSPTGLAAIVITATLFVFAQTIEVASLLLLGRDQDPGGSPFVRASWRTTRELPYLLDLASRQCLVLTVVAAPFLALVGLVYWLLWSRLDLNYLIEVRPPRFWIGAGIAAGIVAVYLAIAASLFVRWIFAIPEVVFQHTAGRLAMRTSARQVKGKGWRVTRIALLWLLATLAFNALAVGILRQVSIFILARTADSVPIAIATAGTLLAVHAVILAAVGYATNALGAFLLLQIYDGPNARPAVFSTMSPQWLPTKFAVLGCAAGIAGLSIVLSIGMVSTLQVTDDIGVTGHRGDARDAPENTVAAFKKAVALGADYGELDVQLSKDGVVVVAHDSDLARLAHINRKIRDMTFAELEEVDIGSAFSPEFKNERIPKLKDIFEAVADSKLKVLVEIKVYPDDDTPQLVKKTVDLIHEMKFSDRCIVISLEYEALELVRKRDPKLSLGYLVSESVGNLAKLDVDYLMVRSKLITPLLISEARRNGKPVFAWTVDEPESLVRLWDRAVANVITNDPAQMIAERKKVRGMSDVERLLLRARFMLGG